MFTREKQMKNRRPPIQKYISVKIATQLLYGIKVYISHLKSTLQNLVRLSSSSSQELYNPIVSLTQKKTIFEIYYTDAMSFYLISNAEVFFLGESRRWQEIDYPKLLVFSIQSQTFLLFSFNLMFLLLGCRFYLLAFKVFNLFKYYLFCIFFNVAQIAS